MNFLGYAYSSGVGTTLDLEFGLKWYKEAADLLHPKSEFIISQFQYYGFLLDEDINEAISLAEMAASKNDEAKSFLAHIYLNQSINSKNFILAFIYHYLNSTKGYLDSINFMAGFFERYGFIKEYSQISQKNPQTHSSTNTPNKSKSRKKGKKGPVQVKKAAQSSPKLSDNNNLPVTKNPIDFFVDFPALAKERFDEFKDNARIYHRDNYKGKHSLTDAYIQKVVDSQSKTYLSSQSILDDDFHFHKLAADLGSKDSLFRLAVAFETGNYLPFDRHMAYDYFQKAKNAGSDRAATILEYYYLINIHPEVLKIFETNDAVILYNFKPRAAVEQLEKLLEKSPEAMYAMGLLLSLGIGLSLNNKKAEHYFTLASDKDSVKSQYELYRIYKRQKGGAMQEKAAQMLTIAANNGHLDAQLLMGYAYKNGTFFSKDQKLANVWFKKAASHNNPDALYELGLTYNFGYGVEKDQKEAFDFFQKAKDLGHPLATLFFSYLNYVSEQFNLNVNTINLPQVDFHENK
jgi:TPR repeat protein